jgi:hypothetical protein
MDVDTARRVDVEDVATEITAAIDELGRHHAILEDALLVIDVVDEAVERADALLETRLDRRPFPSRHQTRQDIEGPDPFDPRLLIRIQGERDAFVMERQMGLARLERQSALAGTLDVLPQRHIVLARLEVVAIELVIGRGRTLRASVRPTGANGLELSQHGVLAPTDMACCIKSPSKKRTAE